MLRNIYTKVINIYQILKHIFEFVLFESLVLKKRIYAHNRHVNPLQNHLEMSLYHYFILGRGGTAVYW